MPRTTLSVPLDLGNPVEARIADVIRSCPPHARHLAVVEALGIGLALHGLRDFPFIPSSAPDPSPDPSPDPVVVALDPAPVESLEDFMSSFRC